MISSWKRALALLSVTIYCVTGCANLQPVRLGAGKALWIGAAVFGAIAVAAVVGGSGGSGGGY